MTKPKLVFDPAETDAIGESAFTGPPPNTDWPPGSGQSPRQAKQRRPPDVDREAPGANEEPRAAAETTNAAVTFGEFVGRRVEGREALIGSEQGTQLPPGGLGILAAKAGDGKTTLAAVDLALHASAGLDYCGLTFARPLGMLVIQNEGPREAFREKLELRLKHWEHDAQPRIWDVPAAWGQVRISNPEVRQQLRAIVEALGIDLVVSDSLTRFGVRGNGTPEETREFMEWLTELGLGRDLAFLLLHHPRTRAELGESELEKLAGAWQPHADWIVLLQKLAGGRARLSFPKARWALADRPASILAFDLETQSFSFVADEEPEERDYVAELAKHMAEGEWWTVTALRQPKAKGGVGAAPDAVKEALMDERFESVTGDAIGERKDATYYRIRQASPAPGDARDASTSARDREEASRVTTYKETVGGDASSRDASSSVTTEEVERLAELARDAQHDDAGEVVRQEGD